jgi:hypothetical protein
MLIGTSCLVSLLAGARGQALAEPAWVPAPAQQVPPRFYVAESVLPRFLDLLQRSPTFRAQ